VVDHQVDSSKGIGGGCFEQKHSKDHPRREPEGVLDGGHQGQHESMLSYCFLGPFRLDLFGSFQEICRRGGAKQLALESVACLVGFGTLLLLSWHYVVMLLVPVLYLGWVLEHIENYYEHFGGEPEDRYANSTSYYGRLYNALFCNEGYHQEHHLRPNVHWINRPQVRVELGERLEQANRVILNLPPSLAWMEHERIAARFVKPLTQTRFEPIAESRVEPEVVVL
jgi:fatty acid desaturase